MRRITAALTTTAALIIPGAAVAYAGHNGAFDETEGQGPLAAVAVIKDVKDQQIGRAFLRPVKGGTEITVVAPGVEGHGFHGLHIHSVGKCEADSSSPTDPTKKGPFLSAGGHVPGTGSAHPDHAGDLPSLLKPQGRSGRMTTVTDRFTINDLMDADGSAIIIHAGPDNFGNIPTRYAPNGPDKDTLATGDSGGRIGCGVVTKIGKR